MDKILEKVKKTIVCLSVAGAGLLILVFAVLLATGNIRHSARSYPESYCHVSFKEGTSCKDPVTERVVAYGYMLFLGGVFLTAGLVSDARNIAFFPVLLLFGLPVWIAIFEFYKKIKSSYRSKSIGKEIGHV